MYPFVSIIILNWNNWRYTLECLESLSRIDYDNFNIILVDNHSSDNSISSIERYCEGYSPIHSDFLPQGMMRYKFEMTRIQRTSHSKEKYHFSIQAGDGVISPSQKHLFLIMNDRNSGFAEGNNIGIRFAMEHFPSEYILLLNNDTVQDSSFLKNLVEGICNHPRAGFAGPKIYYTDYDGHSDIINHAGVLLNMWTGIAIHRGDQRPDSGRYNQIREVDALTGACLLVKREVIVKIGLLNPDYFLYWEETDWCFRGRRVGYACMYFPTSVIWHHVGSATPGPTFQYYYTRNRFWFMRENAKSSQKITYLFFFFFIDLWYSLYRITRQGNLTKNNLFALFKGIKDGISQMEEK